MFSDPGKQAEPKHKTRNRLEEPSALLGPGRRASESNIGPELTTTRRAHLTRWPQTSCCDSPRSCAIMKCAAIALALQGATGLVAPRLTVKSSALNAATLEVNASVAQPRLSLQKDRRARLPPAQKPARSGIYAPLVLLSSTRCKKRIAHTSAARSASPHLGLQKKYPNAIAHPRHQLPNNSPTTP